MLRKSKKGAVAKRQNTLKANVGFLRDKIDSAWAVATPEKAREFMDELVDKARAEGKVGEMVQVAKVMTDYMKLALNAQVQLLEAQRKMDNQTPENQVNVQINADASGGVVNVEEAHDDLQRYLALYGSEEDPIISPGREKRSSAVDRKASEDIGGRANGGGRGTPDDFLSDETEDNPFEIERSSEGDLPEFVEAPTGEKAW